MTAPLIAQGAEEFDPKGSAYTWAELQAGDTRVYVLKTTHRNQYVAYVAMCYEMHEVTDIISWDHEKITVNGTGVGVVMKAIDEWEPADDE